jgi:predicted ribosome quality control (RQC) complex YloA/Tae2 family protein
MSVLLWTTVNSAVEKTPPLDRQSDRHSFFRSADLGLAQDPSINSTTSERKGNPDDPVHLKNTIKRLTREVEHLQKKIADVERACQATSLRDHLIKEEQRAETLQAQLLEVGEKENNLKIRMDEVTIQLRPENLDQLQIAGSLRPEQVRETTRLRLTNEKSRIQSQLDLLHQSRTRLQSSLAVTDMLIQQLRSQLQRALLP